MNKLKTGNSINLLTIFGFLGILRLIFILPRNELPSTFEFIIFIVFVFFIFAGGKTDE